MLEVSDLDGPLRREEVGETKGRDDFEEMERDAEAGENEGEL